MHSSDINYTAALCKLMIIGPRNTYGDGHSWYGVPPKGEEKTHKEQGNWRKWEKQKVSRLYIDGGFSQREPGFKSSFQQWTLPRGLWKASVFGLRKISQVQQENLQCSTTISLLLSTVLLPQMFAWGPFTQGISHYINHQVGKLGMLIVNTYVCVCVCVYFTCRKDNHSLASPTIFITPTRLLDNFLNSQEYLYQNMKTLVLNECGF
ncbi:uncharacterized protein LOC121037652 [Herpailurus yagouaroundi]|uniref:uncharacterized protein LOC121037652 n=1 Tax=Herpailurus yagouaroundi TaxID=1608482 RepID=UPI001AD682B2|nr:uncharacterized protein LOC121037652 [Puma yagouaroundi]